METPGLSLFQDCESINVNNSLREEEEEEYLEGEKRKQELNDLVQNAFDDLTDDDDDDEEGSSINTSLSSDNGSGSECEKIPCHKNDTNKAKGFVHPSNLENSLLSTSEHSSIQDKAHLFNGIAGAGDNAVSMHYNHCFKTSPVAQYKHDESESEVYLRTDYNNIDQLKVLYDVRLKEIEKLNGALEDEKEKSLKLKRVISQLEKERDSALVARKQCTEQLAKSIEKINELEKKLKVCTEEMAVLQRENMDSKNEQKISSHHINELQQQILMMERMNLQKRSDKEVEATIDALKDFHKKEILHMQKQLESMTEKYNKKEEDMNALENKLVDIEKKRASALLERCDSNLLQEATLKALLDDANKERIEMNKKITQLEKENDMLKKDLEQYDSVSNQRLLNSSSDDHETDSILHLGLSRGDKRRSPSSFADLNSKLKDELHRAMLGQKNKRAEIKKLQEQLRNLEVLVAQLKEQERAYLSQIETLKSDLTKGPNQSQERVSGVEEAVRQAIAESEAVRAKEKRELMAFFDKELVKVKGEEEQKFKTAEIKWNAQVDQLLSDCNEIKKLYLDEYSHRDLLMKKLQEESNKQKQLIEEISILKEKLSQKEEEVKRLEQFTQELIKGKNEARPSEGDLISKTVEGYKNQVAKLENEVAKYRSELAELPIKQAMELQALRNELYNSKENLLALNDKLKIEFQNEMKKAELENIKLTEALIKKEQELKEALARHASSETKTVNAAADNNNSSDHSRHEEVLRLKVELEHLKETLSMQNEDMKTLESKYKRKFEEELKEIEKTMRDRHAAEAAEVEKRMKDLTFQFFSDEKNKLETKYKAELKAAIEAEKQALNTLQDTLKSKEEELDNLRKRTLAVEAEKNRASDIMKKWVKEVQEIQAKLLESEKKINLLNIQINTAKKLAAKYKNKLKKHLGECQERYEQFKIHLKSQIVNQVVQKEKMIDQKLREINKQYKQVVEGVKIIGDDE